MKEKKRKKKKKKEKQSKSSYHIQFHIIAKPCALQSPPWPPSSGCKVYITILMCSIQCLCMFQHPTCVPLSCFRRRNVYSLCSKVNYPYPALCWVLWDGWWPLFCCSWYAREVVFRGQWTWCRLGGLFTASDNKGGRSTHVFYLYMLMCVVRKPAVPQWDRAG